MQRGGAFMRKRSRLVSVALSHLTWIALLALPTAVAHAAPTIPFWTNSATAGNSQSYNFTMVGKDPGLAGSGATGIKTHIIPLRFTTSVTDTSTNTTTTYVFDPENNDRCSPKRTPALNMVQASPVFRTAPATSYGLDASLGSGQFASLFQRANFAADIVKNAQNPKPMNPNYQVTLQQTLLNFEDKPKRTIQLPAVTNPPNTSNLLLGPCNPVGLIEIDVLDQMIAGSLLPDLFTHGVRPDSLAVFLLSNVVMYHSDATTGCCILGYHSAIMAGNNEVQTYVVANYDTSGGLFTNAPDIVGLAGTVAGWLTDPVPNSALITTPTFTPPGESKTPPFSATLDDQILPAPPNSNATQTICQALLEPFDPILPLTSGNIFPITMRNNFTYHVPDLAFNAWFYQGGTSPFNQQYSLFGTLMAPAPLTCP
jgi:hypothetical protein